MPTIEQLLGVWISGMLNSKATDKKGYNLVFDFDRLPFDNFTVGKVHVVKGKKSTQHLSGELSLVDSDTPGEFFINLGDVQIMARKFDENSFIANIDQYGEIEFTRK